VLIVAPGRAEAHQRDVVGSLQVSRTLRPISRRRSRLVIEKYSPDFIYTQFAVASLTSNLFSALDLSRFAQNQGATSAIGFHEPVRELALLGMLGRRIYRSASNVADRAIVFSIAALDAMKDLRLHREWIKVSLGTPSMTESDSDDMTRVRTHYGMGDGKVVLSLGFIHPDKGLNVLLGAAAKVSKGTKCSVTFVVAGEPRRRRGIFRIMGRKDRRLLGMLRRYASDLGDSADVAFVGFVPDEDVAPVLRASDVVVLPYTNSTQSAIASLASAAGVAVVASDLPGLREALGHGAIYATPGDSDELADALIRVLNDDELRATLQMNISQELVDGSFDSVARRILLAQPDKQECT
jgi:glycosyltransferase involved in cell wall biosynthesis